MSGGPAHPGTRTRDRRATPNLWGRHERSAGAPGHWRSERPALDRGAGGPASFTLRVLIATGVAGLAAAAVIRAVDGFFLFFLAALLAILLRTAADTPARYVPLGRGWALGVVAAAAAGLLAAGVYAVGTLMAGQADQLPADLVRAVGRVEDSLRRTGC